MISVSELSDHFTPSNQKKRRSNEPKYADSPTFDEARGDEEEPFEPILSDEDEIEEAEAKVMYQSQTSQLIIDLISWHFLKGFKVQYIERVMSSRWMLPKTYRFLAGTSRKKACQSPPGISGAGYNSTNLGLV